MAVLNTVRGRHSTPGIYTRELEVPAPPQNSFGVSTLGLVGETLKGPAMSPISISNWQEFIDIFGGTSTEIYKGSRYPRYELPYIAQDYLTESNQLIVTKILGLSGYNAGKAYIIKALGAGTGDNMVIAVLRSRGHYVKTYGNPRFSSESVASGNIEENVQYVIGRVDQTDNTPLTSSDYITYNGINYTFGQRFFGVNGITDYTVEGTNLIVYGYCGTAYDYDKFIWDAKSVAIDVSSTPSTQFTCGKSGSWGSTPNADIPCTPSDFGTFQLIVTLQDNTTVNYTVSFNPGQKNYIYNVLGSKADDNNTPIFIEELYDVALQQLIYKNGVDPVNYIYGVYIPPQDTTTSLNLLDTIGTNETPISAFQPVNSLLTLQSQLLTKSLLNTRYLYDGFIVTDYVEETVTIVTSPTFSRTVSTLRKTFDPVNDAGKILTVKEDVDSSGRRTYNYYYTITITDGVTTNEMLNDSPNLNPDTNGYYSNIVYVLNEQLFYTITASNVIERVIGDVSDYKEPFRYASTPWVVSQMIGTFANNKVSRLFRFHSISDGNTANQLFKISIVNIDPENLTFDIVIRDFYDDDTNIVVLEQFTRCNLNPDSSNYILNRIGSFDNSFPVNSKYVMVEVSDNEGIKHAIPCGFLGYPVRDLGTTIQRPYLAYNTTLNEEIRERRQYFGLSSMLGIDSDITSYKGRTAYTDGIFTDGFHLDSRISNTNTLVDGENPNGMYTWQVVSVDTVGAGGEAPQITSIEDIQGTIYENISTRKFTLCLYGGFDGWDIYRTSRTTGDEFKMNRYKGRINPNTGQGEHFSIIRNNDELGLPEKGITSDFYAWWAAMLRFSNVSDTPINIFATPGIDYVNNTLLANEAIEMIEDGINQGAIYVGTTPDKPTGSPDSVATMYTPNDVIGNLNNSEIDSSYLTTAYPWLRYFDSNERKTIFLPPTRDIIRLMASNDNKAFPWTAAAGMNARCNCIDARFKLKINDEDILYDGRINPVKTFARDGVFIWGDKNTYISYVEGNDLLTRTSTRRLMIYLRELIIRTNRNLIFAENDSTTRNKFISNCNAVLNNIRSNRGISDFRVIVEDSIEARQQRTLPATIVIYPVNKLEFIELVFAVTPEGVVYTG